MEVGIPHRPAEDRRAACRRPKMGATSGVSDFQLVCYIVDKFVAIGVFLAPQAHVQTESTGTKALSDPHIADAPSRQTLFWLLVCFTCSGMSGLIYEVAWVRSLELIFGATTFAVATV